MNELKSSNSSYLKHHAQNPIHWKTWSEKTLDTALLENKLIVLSIGYSACHWCHVMEKETFSNQQIASFMNQNFISIKVDREEHPEVDNAYMDFIMETKGNGGWPLNCILMPDTTPLYAGTYFQTKQWMQLINRFKVLHNDHPETLLDFTQKYSQHLEEYSGTNKKANLIFPMTLANGVIFWILKMVGLIPIKNFHYQQF